MNAVKHPDLSTPTPQDGQADAFAESIVTAFGSLLSGLTPDQQRRVRNQIFKSFPPESYARAGQVLGTILKLVPRDRPFTIDEVSRKVESEGVQATAKAIHNAIGYLARKQKITRVGRGKYLIEGALLETSEDLGVGPPTRHEIDET